jgi:hypothetical protein
MSKPNILYIGTTNEFNVFHVGMTFDGRDPYDRWRKDAAYCKLPYLVEQVGFFEIGDDTDHPYHEWIRNDGILDLKQLGLSRSPEVFKVPGETHEECIVNLIRSIQNALEYRKTGIRSFSKIFEPRPHQKWVNEKILKMYNGLKTIIVPLYLCARFGKTLQALSLFKDSGLQVMVVASYWLAANESFESTVFQAYDITSDVIVIKPDIDAFKDAISRGKRVIIDVSLHKDAEKIDENLIDLLAEYNKLVYIDEADFGAWKPRSRNNVSPFIEGGNNLVCVATGTNIDRALIGSTGNLQEPIKVSYLDLVEAKRGQGFLFEPGGLCYENPHYWMNTLSDIVDIACLSLDVGKDLVDELNDLSAEKRPNMAKIFSKRNAHIIRKILKNLFFDEMFNSDIFGLYNTKYTPIDHPAAMMFIPGTKQDVNNIVSIGKQIAPHYNWIALHSDEYTNRTAEKKILDIIANGGGERTVIVSCSMGARSFSVPNIVAVVDCKDGGSLGTAVQEASRCFTPGCGKEIGLVVKYSFNPEKTSSFLTDLISSAIQNNPSDTETAIRRVYGLMDFLRKDEEGYLMSLSESDVLEYITSKVNLHNMASAQIDIEGLISNSDLLKILQGIQSKTSGKGKQKEWGGVINKAISHIKTKNKKEKEKEINPDNKAISDLVKKLHSIVESSGNAYYMAPYSNNFKDCLSEIANNPNKNFEYTNLVGIGADTVLEYVYPYLPTKLMDMIILKADEFDAQDNFVSSTSKHSTSNLFDL